MMQEPNISDVAET